MKRLTPLSSSDQYTQAVYDWINFITEDVCDLENTEDSSQYVDWDQYLAQRLKDDIMALEKCAIECQYKLDNPYEL